MTAVGYIRRSASEESPVSEALQRDTVARLAAEHGQTIEHVFKDWGRSGGSEDRPQYLAMLDRLERGGVKAVFAYDQDRLARNIWLFAGLLRLADARGFSIITPAGNLADDRYRDGAEYRAVGDGIELRKIRRRNMAIVKRARERGDHLGAVPFGYDYAPREQRSDEPVRIVRVDPEGIEHVIDTYKRIGSFAGTARALNIEGFRGKNGGEWHSPTVAGLIRREAPELTAGVSRGVRSRTGNPRLLRGILRCHCGGPMSPGVAARGWPTYYCGRGSRGNHPKPYYISESRLMPRIKAEADRLAMPGDVLERPGDAYSEPKTEAAIAALRDAGMDEMADQAQAEYDGRRAEHGERQMIVQAIPPAIDWQAWEADPDHEPWSTAQVNTALRALWDHVELGPDLLPVEDGAVWRVPEWRLDGELVAK